MKNTFTEANGYEASFAYSLKNDEQITALDAPLITK
jgi:simple sugar transport system substrate-binding protein